MNDIQKAREVLAAWRDGMSPHAWDLSPMKEYGDWTVWSGQGAVATIHGWEGDAQTIVGTAGNPALLATINACLITAEQAIDRGVGNKSQAVTLAENFAAAIIAADERMTQ